MKRRTCLGLCAGAGVLSSGCLAPAARPTTKVAWIHLENDRDEARAVAVFVERNDEEVFRETYHLGSSAEQATARVDDPVTGAGHYTIYVDVGGQVAHLLPSDYADVTEPCIGIRYTLHERATTGFELEPVHEC